MVPGTVSLTPRPIEAGCNLTGLEKMDGTASKHSPVTTLLAAAAVALGALGASAAAQAHSPALCLTRPSAVASCTQDTSQPSCPKPQPAHEPCYHLQRAPARPPTPHFDWLNPNTWPVLPVPYIAVGPNSGTTIGIIPTMLHTNAQSQITRIIAPDITHNPYFGLGVDARIFEYPSLNTQWSIVAGMQQRVQSYFDALWQTGLLRESHWTTTLEADYDRSGTPRFYGFGNNSLRINQTNYTKQQMFVRAKIGYNFNHAWQLAYTFEARKVKVSAGTLRGIPSITQRFVDLLGLGTTHELLNRISLIYDTRNNIVIPTSGMDVVVYGGVASRNVSIDDSLFTEAGADGRFYWSPTPTLTVATHFDLRYEPTTHHVPFWGLSSLGGDASAIGGSQPLRGYGTARFYDRNAFVANIELRQTVLSLNTLSTHILIQVTPFFDTGRVFHNYSTSPFTHLHNVFGIGFRGIAPPSVVGYVDVGDGSEGIAVFTGINYPF